MNRRDDTGETEAFMSKEEQEKLFAEWDADYAARRAEERLRREGPPARTPSQIAQENRNKPSVPEPDDHKDRDRNR